MKVTLHRTRGRWDVAAFAAAAEGLLAADPVGNTVALTVLDRLRVGTDEPARLLTVHRGGRVVGAALRCVGRPLVVAALPPGCADAADAASVDADPAPDAVTGPVAQAEAYAAAHVARTGGSTRVRMRQRLFRLVTLCPPRGVPGAARLAGPDDVDLVARWQDDFVAEAIPDPAPLAPGDGRPGLLGAMANGFGFVLWEVDGDPVAYAVARRPTAGMSRIGPVYTPRAGRGHGYGSAVTAAAAAWAQDAGAREVVLFTDLANPVSNAIYPRIGFHPVGDALELGFAP